MNTVAIHEAGHLVMANALGVSVWGAFLNEGKGAGGGAFHDPSGCTDTQKIMICLAGCLAAARVGETDLGTSESDFSKVAKNAGAGPYAEQAIKVYADQANDILTEWWPSVLALATALDRNKSMTGDECLAILKATRPTVWTHTYVV